MDGVEGIDAPRLLEDGVDGIDEGIEGMEGMVDGIEAPPPPPELPDGMRELLAPPELPPDGMLELLPPLEPPDDPLDPPEEPLEPLDGLGGTLLGVGMELDCCSAHPPIRKLEIAPTAVTCAATTSSRWIVWLLFIASLQLLARSCSQSAKHCGAVVPPFNRATTQLNAR